MLNMLRLVSKVVNAIDESRLSRLVAKVVNAVDQSPLYQRWKPRFVTLFQLPFKAITILTESSLSRRGLPVTFCAVAAALVVITCLRPTMSGDIASYRIPLGILKGGDLTPEEIHDGSHRIPHDSAGLLVLALCVAGMGVGWFAPKYFPYAAGVLLAGSIVAVTAITINHPALIQLLDREYEQREQIVSVVHKASISQPVVVRGNGRVSEWNSPGEEERQGDMVRGWIYLRYGIWLVAWAVLGAMMSPAGALWRRLRFAGAWALLGGVLACGVCSRRLYAEYQWSQAQELEARRDYAGARKALDAAVARCPEFEQLERTWLLRGKLDWREGRSTTEARFFHVYQLSRDKSRPQAYATGQDLPWLITGTKTYREGGASPNVGFETLGNPIRPPTTLFALDDRRGQFTPKGPLALSYESLRKLEQRQALHASDELFAEAGESQPLVRHQAARMWADSALNYFTGDKVSYLTGREYALEHRELLASFAAWQKAAQRDPSRRDLSFFLAMVQLAVDREHPAVARAQLATAMTGLADLPLHAYVASTLGDAYLEAGHFSESRRSYAESYDVFNLPKKINIHAQRALGGL
jgi:tetratricopeptide (TPR) repeat protein